MSNIVEVDFSAVPAFARGKSAIAEALQDSLAGGVKRLSIRGGTWRYIAGGQEIGKNDERHIDVVLVNAAPHVARTYYEGVFVEGEKAKPPVCWSTDGKLPDVKSSAPQGVNCANCKQNVKGSGQGDSKACRFSQRLALVLANDINGEVLQLTLPATSLFGDTSEAGASLQGYYKGLAARSLDPAALVTRMKFDTSVSTPKVGFTAVKWLTQEEYDAACRQGKSEMAERAITMTVFEADAESMALPAGTAPVMQAEKPAASAKTPTKAADKPSVAAAPVAPKEVKEYATGSTPVTADEPVVRKTDTVAAATNPKLAALVAEWGTDD